MTLVSCLVFVAASLLTAVPVRSRITPLMWNPAYWRNESRQLKNLAWYRNYRYQSAGLLALALIIVAAWW